ncbi:MAG: tetratricopeptide repeat protein [Pirellulales bacterium]|nr:tetratricopeptide repeat protein [Pirellulales bacterium]
MKQFFRIIAFVLAAAVLAQAAPAGRASDPGETAGPELAGPTESAWPPNDAAADRHPAEKSPWPPPTTTHSRSGGDARPRELPPSVATPLKTPPVAPERSDQLEFVARQADRQTMHAFELAGRGALFAARAEFLGSLRLIAEGLDTEHKTDVHRRALSAALTALREAEDFSPGGSGLEIESDLSRTISTHVTPVLKDGDSAVTSITAMKCYFTFAQEQFAAAAGSEVAGSMALRGLGKLHDAMAGKSGLAIKAAAPKAVVFYQAALLVFPENYLAANDLGVLLARSGKYSSAKKMFEYSLAFCRQSATWRNLAVVCRQLGEEDSALRAESEAAWIEQVEIARRNEASVAGNAPVRWVDPRTMAQTSSGAPVSPAAAQPPADGNVRTAERRPAARRTHWGRPTQIK